MDYAYTLGRST